MPKRNRIPTEEVKAQANLLSVKRVKATGKYRFILEDASSKTMTFDLSPDKALAVANSEGLFPLGVTIKIAARKPLGSAGNKLSYVKILSVDGVEISAWAERNASPTVAPDKVAAAQGNIADAQAAEDAMRDKAPPESAEAITDPATAYEKAHAIIRRQYKLKNPRLSKQEIWVVRDALNLLAEKLGIA